MLETPRNIDKSLRSGNERSRVKEAKKSGLGNALGLLTIVVIATNFDKINGVSFTKGCFVGQEVTARMRHKTTLKNGIIKFQSTTDELKLNNIITNEDGKKVRISKKSKEIKNYQPPKKNLTSEPKLFEDEKKVIDLGIVRICKVSVDAPL